MIGLYTKKGVLTLEGITFEDLRTWYMESFGVTSQEAEQHLTTPGIKLRVPMLIDGQYIVRSGELLLPERVPQRA